MDNKYTPFQKRLEIISWLLLILSILFLIISWDKIPDKVPMHYSGLKVEDIDRYGNKTELIPIILIFLIIYFVIVVMSFFPGDYNMPYDSLREHKTIVNSTTKTMWLLVRIEYIGLVVVLLKNIIQAKSLDNGLFTFILIIGITVLYFSFKIDKYKTLTMNMK